MSAVAAALLAGCGETNPLRSATLYPVKGKVVLPDGKALTAGNVIFTGMKTTITNTFPLGSDGSFSKDAKEGLPEGEYKVFLQSGDTAPAKKRAKLPFASKFLDEDASGWTATVKPEGSNEFEFKLTAK